MSNPDDSDMASVSAEPSLIEEIGHEQLYEVNKHNFERMLPVLTQFIKKANVVALDLEMSGLGSRKQMRAKDVVERYKGMRGAALSRGILSFGIACFKFLPEAEETAGGKQKSRREFSATVFNLLTLPDGEFTIETQAMDFLRKYGFDFNKVTEDGIRYYPGATKQNCPLHTVFKAVLCHAKNVVLHNGLLDMCFLYGQLYAELPETFDDFLAALSELFPPERPIIDTKVFAEFVGRATASFLELVYRKCQRLNIDDALRDRFHLRVHFGIDATENEPFMKSSSGLQLTHKLPLVDVVNCALPADYPNHIIPSDLKQRVCLKYANFGVCSQQSTCSQLHDIDFTLDLACLAARKAKKRKISRFQHLQPSGSVEQAVFDLEHSITAEVLMQSKPRSAVVGSHRAGVDAFMTGFAALSMDRYLGTDVAVDPALVKFRNSLSLPGKNFPLKIRKTATATLPESHVQAFEHISTSKSW